MGELEDITEAKPKYSTFLVYASMLDTLRSRKVHVSYSGLFFLILDTLRFTCVLCILASQLLKPSLGEGFFEWFISHCKNAHRKEHAMNVFDMWNSLEASVI